MVDKTTFFMFQMPEKPMNSRKEGQLFQHAPFIITKHFYIFLYHLAPPENLDISGFSRKHILFLSFYTILYLIAKLVQRGHKVDIVHTLKGQI